jgi:hypothetical protein
MTDFLDIIHRLIFYLKLLIEMTLPPSSGKKLTSGPEMGTSSIDWKKTE